MDYLKARGIMAFRMNSGAMFGSYKGKTWKVQMNPAGTADILAFTHIDLSRGREIYPIWIETKREGGKQSPAQKEFQKMVEGYGMEYYVVHSADELSQVL